MLFLVLTATVETLMGQLPRTVNIIQYATLLTSKYSVHAGTMGI